MQTEIIGDLVAGFVPEAALAFCSDVISEV